jgi:hypothetical protein
MKVAIDVLKKPIMVMASTIHSTLVGFWAT